MIHIFLKQTLIHEIFFQLQSCWSEFLCAKMWHTMFRGSKKSDLWKQIHGGELPTHHIIWFFYIFLRYISLYQPISSYLNSMLTNLSYLEPVKGITFKRNVGSKGLWMPAIKSNQIKSDQIKWNEMKWDESMNESMNQSIKSMKHPIDTCWLWDYLWHTKPGKVHVQKLHLLVMLLTV